MKLRNLRIGSQVFFLLIFILLLFKAAYPLTGIIPVDIFLRLDPLVALTAMVAARTVITTGLVALVTLALAALVGRFFCAYVCPLGTTIDLFDTLFFRKYRKARNQKDRRFRRLKYYILSCLVVCALFGLNLVFLFDPIAIVTRIYTLVIIPFIMTLGNLGVGLTNHVTQMLDTDTGLAYFSFKKYYFIFSLGTVVLLILITGLNIFQSRFWCRNLCPLGALLSLVSRFGLVRRSVTDHCTQCQRCRTVCPMGAIPEEVSRTVLAECTLCGSCTADCEHQYLGPVRPFTRRPADEIRIGIHRRQFLHSCGIAAAAALVSRTGLRKKVVDEGVIRPPGTLPEPEFLDRCVRCGECMKVCKTNCLQPALLESGWDGFLSPRAVFRIGGCEKACHLCGQVCPTGAIRRLTLEEKQFAKLGTAVINRRRCIAWEQNKLCLICDEICPYDAIEYRVVDEFTGPFKKPFVLEDKCVGCGMCEQKCPVQGQAAIRVGSEGEERKASGSYITERKKQLRRIESKEFEKDGIVNFGHSPGEPSPAGKPAAPAEQTEKLPAGFINE